MLVIASRRFAVTCALVCALGLGMMGTAHASASPPAGFQRVRVEGLPLSLALPDDWFVERITRVQAKKAIKENPQLVQQGMTVEKLLAVPLNAGVDVNGDTYPDRYLTIQKLPGAILLSPSQAKSEFVKIPGVHDGVAVARSTVAGKPALRVTYAQDGNRDNGTPFTVYSNTYVFVAHGTGMMLQFFRADESDRDFLATVGSILKSVKT